MENKIHTSTITTLDLVETLENLFRGKDPLSKLTIWNAEVYRRMSKKDKKGSE
jgi:hypothetical protein